jgi:hypothetical protein
VTEILSETVLWPAWLDPVPTSLIALYERLLAETDVTKDQVRYAELVPLLAAELAKDEKPPPSRSQGY